MMPVDYDMRGMLSNILRRLTILERQPSASGSGGAARMPGEIIMWAGANPPAGAWQECNGASLVRADYPALFAAIGTVYGAPSGTTFRVPDMRGRVPVAQGASAPFTTLGATGGAATHTLTVDEMPSHTHTQNPHTHNVMGALKNQGSGTQFRELAEAASPLRNDASNAAMATTATNQNTGGGGAHNNLQPYIVVKFFIKT